MRYLALLAVISCMGTASAAGYDVQTVASDLRVPWSLDFAPDGRIFVTERDGRLLAIDGDRVEVLLELDVSGGEGGLLGVVLDPDFESNGHLYLYYTYQDLFWTYNKISRFTETDGAVSDELVLVDEIPGGIVHNGGRIRFGPDGALYAGTGEAGLTWLSQDLESLGGKILRINPDGSIPPDNPFAGSPVYALGLRNTQGFDWHPETGRMYATDHGPSGERGRAHDEVNLIEPGGNYGWPETVGDEQGAGYIDPILHTGDIVWAPSGASFYDSNKIADLSGQYLVANLYSRDLRALNVTGDIVSSDRRLFDGQFGRLRDVQTGPDGALYILTSNQDGRGSPAQDDDRIIRITSECRDEMVPLYWPSRTDPICVWPETAQVLVGRGWHDARP